jgi:hypothetical protein
MALHRDDAARRECLPLLGQIEPQRRLDGVGGAALALALRRCRVLAQADTCMQAAGRLAGRTQGKRGRGAERHASLFAADAVLEDPGPLAAAAQAQAEARHVVVEEDRICLAGRQREAVDRRLGEFHWEFDPDLGSSWECRSGFF